MGKELVKCTLDVVSVQLVRRCEGDTIRLGILFCAMERNLTLQ